MPEFTGAIEQRPPAFSALKVKGRRAYQLAREGQVVELAPRPISIYDLRLVEFEYPRFVLQIECGSGTYVRSLGRDIAQRLGTGAIMSDLVRTGIGCFPISEAISPDEITKENISEYLLPAALAIGDLPKVVLNEIEIGRIANGLSIDNRFSEISMDADEIAAVNAYGKLLAILVHRKGGLGPLRNFNDSV